LLLNLDGLYEILAAFDYMPKLSRQTQETFFSCTAEFHPSQTLSHNNPPKIGAPSIEFIPLRYMGTLGIPQPELHLMITQEADSILLFETSSKAELSMQSLFVSFPSEEVVACLRKRYPD
jgi:hypothetical protein